MIVLERSLRGQLLCVCPLQPLLAGAGACPPAPLMRNDADHAATGISCANIRKATSGMLLRASCVRACERVWVRTRVPKWQELLPAELARAALGDRAGVGVCALLQRCFPGSSAAPYVLATPSARAGVRGRRRQAAFCSQWAQEQGQPHCGVAQVAVPMADPPAWTVQPGKNPTAHVA